MPRLAIVCSHPIQYLSPVFRALAVVADIQVFYAHRATASDQAAAGFDVPFAWDADLLSGYPHVFLRNVSETPGTGGFNGCDTPEVGSLLRAGGFDAVLVTGWHLKSYWQAVAACITAKIPVMVRSDSHLSTPRSATWVAAKRLIYPLALRRFSAALCVGQRSREYFLHYGYPAERLFVAPHAIDVDWFASRSGGAARRDTRARLGIDADEQVLLFAGKLVDFKRPLDVLDAAARLRTAGCKALVMVAGAGQLEAALRARAIEMRVPLHFLGFQNQSQMPAAYAAADALVLPSTGRETWGLVANEALVCGLPIVISEAVGCAPDLAIDGLVGRTYPLGDIQALATALHSLFASPPDRDIVRARGRGFGPDATVRGILEGVEACVARDPREYRRSAGSRGWASAAGSSRTGRS